MNLTNDGRRIITVDKLVKGDIIPAKDGGMSFEVLSLTPYPDPFLGDAVLVGLERNGNIYHYTMRPWEKIATEVPKV